MDLIRACKQLIIKDPFYGLFLLSLNKYYSDEIDTLGVKLNGINYELMVNPIYWNTLTDEEQLGVLKHELLHIAFKHLLIRSSFSDKKLFNIAADIEVNQYIDVLPDGLCTLQTVDPLLPPKAGTKYYYEFLYKEEKEKEFRKESKIEKGQNSEDGNEDIKEPRNHDQWQDSENKSEAEKQLISNQIDYVVKQTATQVIKNRGTIPKELEEYVGSLFKVNPPVFNWKAYFRRMLGFAIDVFVRKSHRKISKRFEGLAGIKLKHKHDILVAIDTSGSVSDKELKDFMSEIYHIWKAGANIDIVECDAKINRMYPFKGTFDGKFNGRGGTDYRPVIDYYNASRKYYSTLVFFTDGYAPTNTFKVLKQMIWVITSNGNRNNRYPWYSIFIPNDNGSK